MWNISTANRLRRLVVQGGSWHLLALHSYTKIESPHRRQLFPCIKSGSGQLKDPKVTINGLLTHIYIHSDHPADLRIDGSISLPSIELPQ